MDPARPDPSAAPDPRNPGSGDAPAPYGGAAGGAEERKGFLLRLPPALLAELRSWAGQELRSLNGHIEYLLRDALRRRR